MYLLIFSNADVRISLPTGYVDALAYIPRSVEGYGLLPPG
jgi:hypothetical protein